MIIKFQRREDTITGCTVDLEPPEKQLAVNMADVIGRRLAAGMIESAGGKAAAMVGAAHADLVAALTEYTGQLEAGSDAAVAGATLARTLHAVTSRLAHGTTTAKDN